MDLMDGLGDLLQGQKVDIFYSDPPWGQGLLNYFQTLNTKQTGAERKMIDNDCFIRTFFDLARRTAKDLILVEYGEKWADQIQTVARSVGLQSHGIAKGRYGSKSKWHVMDLHIFSKSGDVVLPKGYLESMRERSSFDFITTALKPFAEPGYVILDPCCGKGLTARAARHYGMTFLGNEINLKRLRNTMKILERAQV